MADALKIIAWDDARCTEPIAAAGSAWTAKTGMAMEVAVRPLVDFNDQPLRELSTDCDLMVVDYPHVAQAVADKAIVSFEEIVGSAAVAPIAEGAVGNAQSSFLVGDAHAALACDAACHLSASRPDKIAELGCETPSDWSDVFELLASDPGSVAAALYHTDALAILMSLAHGGGCAPDGGARLFPDAGVARECARTLSRFASAAPEYCWDSTPQDIFRIAADGGEIAYIPLTFGYIRKGRREEGGWRFAPPPERCGSLLGGAGMAISSQSARKREAAEFALWYCGSEGQILASRNSGQPSNSAAWDDPDADADAARFFEGSRATQEIAFVRPLAPWWPAAQTEMGEVLVEELRRRSSAEYMIAALESVYCGHWAEIEA